MLAKLRYNFLHWNSYVDITKLAVPLVLSNAGLVFMQFADAMFLARYSSDAIAAAGMGGMVSWLISSLFIGIVGYTSVVTANNVGAGQENKIGIVNWQGMYLACVAGAITFLMGFGVEPLFRLIGHAPEIQVLEAEYLRVFLFGNVTFFLQAALSGFFSGRGDNFRLMAAQMFGQLMNVGLDYCMIFGEYGFPEWGVAGAAWATVISTGMSVAVMMFMFLMRKNRQRYHTHRWHLHMGIVGRLLRFGLASGIQMWIDAMVWTIFLLVIGRIGTVELAATSIAFRLNGLAFMPVVGLSRGMGTLVGQCHGARDFKGAIRYMCHGTMMSQVWMLFVALTFVLFPDTYFGMFSNDGQRGTVSFEEVVSTGRVLLYFVGAYCLGDAINIALSSALHSVGDTKWTSIVMSAITFVLAAVLIFAGYRRWGLYEIWTCATVFILILPPLWIYRIHSGHWKSIRVATD